MKQLALFLLSISALHVNSQTKPTHSSNEVSYFIDSVLYSVLPLFDERKIAAIRVVNDQDKTLKTKGRIYISTKDPKGFRFLSLGEIAKQKTPDGSTVLFMIENEFVKDTSGIKIDSDHILKCELVHTGDFNYNKTLPSFTILKIIAKTKENLEKENRIYIKGKELSLLAGQ